MNQGYNVIGVIGDVHTENELLEKAITFLKLQQVETILCTGDIVDRSVDANKCCEILSREEILVVSGNHDRWLLIDRMRDLEDATPSDVLSDNSRSFLSSLPTTQEFLTIQGLALLCHGLDRIDTPRSKEKEIL